MKTKFKKIISISLIVITLGFIVYFLIYWGFNSELTVMQIALKKWYIIIGSWVFGALSMWFDESNNKI